MRIVIDTNVFVSGVFFTGVPYEILNAWRHRRVQIVASPSILDEYRRIGEVLAKDFPGVQLQPFLSLFTREVEMVSDTILPERVCVDPEDDRFIACALEGRCPVIVSGDRHLKSVSGYRGLVISSPRDFFDKHLRRQQRE